MKLKFMNDDTRAMYTFIKNEFNVVRVCSKFEPLMTLDTDSFRRVIWNFLTKPKDGALGAVTN